MIRGLLAVGAGFVTWTILWLSLNALLQASVAGFDGKSRIESTSVLLILLAGSVVFSVVAGYLTAWMAPCRKVRWGIALGLLQLAIGIFVQRQFWDQMPVWYHLGFLSLLVPGNVAGAMLGKKLPPARRGGHPSPSAP